MRLTSVGRSPGQRGQILVIVAGAMTVLLLMAAFVFDVGGAYLERRQDVASADAGALAGATMLLQTSTVDKNQVGQTAVEVARQNLHAPPSIAAWNDLFAACTDPGRNTTIFPAGSDYRPILSDGRVTDCVHFNPSFTRIRVRLPDQVVNTNFARLIGMNALTTSAESEAQVIRSGIGAGIPLAVDPASGNSYDLLCIRLDKKCSGPTNQGTRALDSPLVGNDQYGTVRSCGSMRSPPAPGDGDPGSDGTLYARAASNVAMGLDHMVVIRNAGPPVAPRRSDDCGALNSNSPVPLPNWIYAVQYDNLVSQWPAAARTFTDGIALGLLTGSSFSDGKPARLQRYPSGWQTRTLALDSGNVTVDDRPLWDYIRTDATNIPATCVRSTFDTRNPADPDNTGPGVQHMANCLAAWTPVHAPLFDARTGSTPLGLYDIQFSPRSGVFPLITATNGGTNYPPSLIKAFESAYIHTIYFAATSTTIPYTEYNAGSAPTDNPIVGTPAPLTGKSMVGMAVFRIKDGMLPPVARPDQSANLNGTVSLTR